MLQSLLQQGGLTGWPLLALSLASLAMIVERGLFWLILHRPGRRRQIVELARSLRDGDLRGAAERVRGQRHLYARAIQALTASDNPPGAVELVEEFRPELERFMPALSTVITAAPMLGILGTVLGIIASFGALTQDAGTAPDPRLVGAGIAEALITTAAGLTIALVTLLPYNAYRAHVDRSIGWLTLLTVAAERGRVGK